ATSPWYNFFEEIEVKPFRRGDAEELIERPIRGMFKLKKGVVDRIISLTGGSRGFKRAVCAPLRTQSTPEATRNMVTSKPDPMAPLATLQATDERSLSKPLVTTITSFLLSAMTPLLLVWIKSEIGRFQIKGAALLQIVQKL
ncbi:MAG: hypothetical protein ACWGMT_10465, partial [Burkholderiales bacterium]